MSVLDSVGMFPSSTGLGLVGDRLAGFQVAEEVQNLELKLISSEQVPTSPGNARHFKKIDREHTIYEFEVLVRGRFRLLSIELLKSLVDMLLLVLQEEEPQERNVVGQFLELDDISQGHFGVLWSFRGFFREALDLALNLEVNASLAQVVVLDECLTDTELLIGCRALVLLGLLARAAAFEVSEIVNEVRFFLVACLGEESVISLKMSCKRLNHVAFLVLQVSGAHDFKV